MVWVSPKQDGLCHTTQARSSLGRQGADGCVVLQLQGEVGLVDDPVGAEDHHLTGLAGKVHLHIQAERIHQASML